MDHKSGWSTQKMQWWSQVISPGIKLWDKCTCINPHENVYLGNEHSSTFRSSHGSIPVKSLESQNAEPLTFALTTPLVAPTPTLLSLMSAHTAPSPSSPGKSIWGLQPGKFVAISISEVEKLVRHLTFWSIVRADAASNQFLIMKNSLKVWRWMGPMRKIEKL